MTVYDVALVPLILAAVQMFKSLGLPKKYSPVVASVLGIVAGIFYVAPGNVAEGILVGLSLGLAAAGLYSGTKNVKEEVRRQ